MAYLAGIDLSLEQNSVGVADAAGKLVRGTKAASALAARAGLQPPPVPGIMPGKSGKPNLEH